MNGKKKIGLPVPDRSMPKLNVEYIYVKETTTPGPNRLFTPIQDNRDYIMKQMKQEQERLIQQRFNPQNIERM